MNYRHIYMLIIEHAKSEEKLGLRKKGNGIYYERHHILPKSLFPLWEHRYTNIVLLTAREHFFCHKLLTKIWPGREMNFALAAFLFGYNSLNKQGVQRKGEYKITSRDYERIRQNLAIELSIMQKKIWSNKTEEERKLWGQRISDNFKNVSEERRTLWNEKYKNTISKRTEDDWNAINEKSMKTKSEWSNERRLEYLEKLSNNTKGRKWFNNGIVEVLRFECPEGYSKGRIPDRESRIKAGQTNRERNKTRGSAVSRMTEEQYNSWRKKISDSHKLIAKEVYANMSDEAKKTRSEKISNSLKGRKHSDEFKKKVSEGILNSPKHKDAVEKCAAFHRGKKFFNNGEICILAETCPDGFVPGRIKKQGNHKNSEEK